MSNTAHHVAKVGYEMNEYRVDLSVWVQAEDYGMAEDVAVASAKMHEDVNAVEVVEVALTGQSARFIARFSAQAWMRDQAVEVDAQGPTEWDVTDAFNALPVPYRAPMCVEMSDNGDTGEALDNDDALKSDPNAPEWVREWSGPFSIYVRLSS